MQVEANNDNMDKEFEDYAWSQMNVLLDQEMPVEKKKRRGFFWLFGLLLLGLSVGAATFYFFNKEDERENLVPIAVIEKDKKVLQKKLAKVDETTTNNRSETEPKEEVNNAALEKSSLEKATMEKLERNRINHTKKYAQSTLSDQNIDKQIRIISKQEVVKNNLTTQGISEPQQELNSNESTIISQDQLLSNTQAGQLNNTEIYSMNRTPIEPLASAVWSITTTPKIAKKTNWEIGIRAGGIATFDENTNAFLGTQLQYQLARKWRIQTGADWIISANNNRILADFSVAPDSANTVMMEEDLDNNTERFAEQTNADSVFQISRNYDFISVPLSIDYHFQSRWSAYAGVQLMMPIRINLATNEEDLQDVAFGAPLETSKPIDIKTSLQWHTGFTFHASPKWKFDLSYHHLFPRQGGRNHLEKYVQFGVQYRLGKF